MSQPRIPPALSFLDAVTGHVERNRTSSADRPIRLAKVDPAYDPFISYPGPVPPCRVTFEGESILSAKAYAVADGFIPRAGQRVYMLPQGNGYLVAGSLNGQSPQGFWHTEDGLSSGVELGHGNYWDTEDGLFLETDATVQGTLQHGPRGLRAPETQVGTQVINGPGIGTSITSGVFNFPVAWPVGTTVRLFPQIVGSAGPTAHSMARPQNVTHSGFQLVILKTDAARVNYLATDSFTVDWAAHAYPTS